jgi:hypothetical protein
MMKCVGSLTALFTLALVACGGGRGVSPASPTQPTTSPPPAQLSISIRCGGPFHPGQYVGLACVAEVSNVSSPVSVHADMSIFGRPADAGFTPSPGAYDLDLRVPADMTPGVKTFAVWAIDLEGHRADTSASIEVAGPPSQLNISSRCFGPVHPGQDLPVACIVSVQDVNYPQENSFDVWADLRIFGQPAQVQAIRACSGCSGSPWAYVVALHVPANMTPGVKTFAVWVGGSGTEHRADTTASLEVVPP